MHAEPQREEELFDAARKLSDASERAIFLGRSCMGNPAMKARIEALLAAESEAEEFFAEGSTVLTRPGAALQFSVNVLNASTSSPANLPGEEPLGSRIGRYKLLEKIGEGGCGVVYMAEQEEPVRRRVALKIIKLGMETKSVIARFEAERQALAMMDHPNIARVFDAGATDRGPPYFVMELVRGVKITEYCDRNRLTIRQRLDLFIQSCHAIQHAHQKGIIHGDIKPSNIMVALHDGIAVPKVIDFGISKATEARLIDRSRFATIAALIGTPAYMSPEQAEMGGVDIDTRSDIYSLGVLLYELLTGKTPFDSKELSAVGLDEMRRILREKEPPRPSARLTALPVAELRVAADARGENTGELISLVRGDLDWVVMKALEKDRGRRYETANGLAMDIQRHLGNETVVARPPSWRYRLQKLIRRNRVVFAAGGAVALALVIGMSTSTWLFLRERDAHQRAVAAEQQQSRLRHEAELREKITQAALLVSQEKFVDADNLVNEISLIQPTVEAAAVLRAIAEWHAVNSRWKSAADRFNQLLRVNQFDGSDTATLDDLRCGPVLVELGDANAYERFREEAINRFSAVKIPATDRILKISLLLPADKKNMTALAPFAAATTRYFADADAGGDVFQSAWLSVSLALWEYRSGNYAKAEEWCRRCLSYPEVNAPRTATAHVILAMALNRGGHPLEALAELQAGRDIVESKFKQKLGSPVQGFWFDWIFARILLREGLNALDSTPSP